MKGFTLIELLAVLVILTIITAITTPIVLNVIEESKASANLTQAKMVLDAADNFYNISVINDENLDKFNGNLDIYDLIETSGNKPNEGSVVISPDGKIALSMYMDGKCYTKGVLDDFITVLDVSKEECSVEKEISDQFLFLNGTNPNLIDGLYPVVIESDGTIVVVDENSIWYDYEEKIWANAIMLKSGTAEIGDTYKLNSEGEYDEVAAIYVWIPRYEYTIFDTDVGNTNDLEDKDDMKLIVEQGGIDINFTLLGEKMPSDYSTIQLGDTYVHPAFEVDGKLIEGFWTGKFELTGDSTNPTVLPNVTALKNLNVSSFFETTTKIDTLYLNNDDLNKVDSHMIKNMEWGAIAYLSFSTFGINEEVYINNNSSHITGCGSNTTSSAATSSCLNSYGSKDPDEKYMQSTTGNISGIFDMVGGAGEYVMANLSNSAGNFYPGTSGFVTAPETRYYDSYAYGTSRLDYTRGYYGDATREVIGWNGDSAHFISSTFAWTHRSGNSTSGSYSGMFHFGRYYGAASTLYSTRSTLWVYR